MTKAELRRQFLQKRKALDPTEVSQRSELITDRFFDLLITTKPAASTTLIHIFLPIQRNNEVNTWLVIRRIWARYAHLHVVVPVTDVLKNTLCHYQLFPQTPVVENHWGIPEPIILDQQPQQPTDFDVVLVPLLIFDQQGQRIGYGGGFYDRFLAECRPDCLKVGLSLFEPIDQINDIESTDIQLNSCITPEYTCFFK